MSTLATGFKPETSQTATIGLLLLGSVLAALWVGINLAFPALAPTGIPSVVTRLGVNLAILTGLWLGLARTEFSASKRILIWLAVAVPFTIWPGPLQIFGLDIPASLAGTYPIVLIPAFAVPTSILLHALSIWQLRRTAHRQHR